MLGRTQYARLGAACGHRAWSETDASPWQPGCAARAVVGAHGADEAPVRVGDTVVHVERFTAGGIAREIWRVTIARETRAHWIDASGTRWRKSDGAKVPQYFCGPRFILSLDDFETEMRRKA